MSRGVLILAAVAALLSACDHPQHYDSTFLAMGTRVDISVAGDDSVAAIHATGDIEQSMLQWSKDWYPWGDMPGELKQLNAAFASGNTISVSPALRNLLVQAETFYRASDGYFDPAIAPMIHAWGFDNAVHTGTHSPDALQLNAQLAAWQHDHPTMRDVIIQPGGIHSTRPDVQLDMGAIAKGYALDLAMERLRHLGVKAAAINIGGQIEIMGDLDQGMRDIQIRDARKDAALASLRLNGNESISTSGDYERFIVINGKRFGHVLDPHTGMPVQHTQMVTVIANTATGADAASTALMAAGPGNWQRVAKQMAVSQVLRVDATGEIQVSGAMYARLHWHRSALQSHRIVIVSLK